MRNNGTISALGHSHSTGAKNFLIITFITPTKELFILNIGKNLTQADYKL